MWLVQKLQLELDNGDINKFILSHYEELTDGNRRKLSEPPISDVKCFTSEGPVEF